MLHAVLLPSLGPSTRTESPLHKPTWRVATVPSIQGEIERLDEMLPGFEGLRKGRRKKGEAAVGSAAGGGQGAGGEAAGPKVQRRLGVSALVLLPPLTWLWDVMPLAAC